MPPDNVLVAYREPVVTVNPYVHPKHFRTGSAAVRVTMQMNYPSTCTIPRLNWVVVHVKLVFADSTSPTVMELIDQTFRNELPKKIRVVMVPVKEDLVTVQSCQYVPNVFAVSKGKISEVEPHVVRLYDTVVVDDKTFSHIVNVLERTIGILDDVLMSEVHIRRKKGVVDFCLHKFCRLFTRGIDAYIFLIPRIAKSLTRPGACVNIHSLKIRERTITIRIIDGFG
jgi:hypothetical protein